MVKLKHRRVPWKKKNRIGGERQHRREERWLEDYRILCAWVIPPPRYTLYEYILMKFSYG